ncbi:MAG: hypothetical protein AAFR17_09250 [Pseudomonadota bacterium]
MTLGAGAALAVEPVSSIPVALRAGPIEDSVPAAACPDSATPCTWERVYGTSADDKAYGVVPLPGGDFLAAGNTRPNNGANYDAWLMRVSPAGTLLWEEGFGGGGADEFHDIALLPSGTVVAAGHTRSTGAGGSDGWIIRTDAQGRMINERVLGGPGDDRIRSVASLADGGYLLVGESASESRGGDDLWVLRAGSDGEILWQRRFGGAGDDRGYDVIALSDGGMAIAGQSWIGPQRGYDLWILRLDPDGSLLWERTLDTDRFEMATALVETPAGDLAIIGTVGVNGTLSDDLWAATLSADGDLLWSARHGGMGRDTGWGLDVTPGGDLLIAAITWSGGAVAGDAWILSLDPSGKKLWERRFGGRYWDRPTGILALETGMIVVGHTSSKGFGFEDAWLLKLDHDGRIQKVAP